MKSSLKLETNHKAILAVMTKHSREILGKESIDDSAVDPANYHFVMGDGLVIYEPNGVCVEMNGLVDRDDMPETGTDRIKYIKEQWRYLASLGFTTVYSLVPKQNRRSRRACRALGMDLKYDEDINIYQAELWQ